jgi:hypothetical protein
MPTCSCCNDRYVYAGSSCGCSATFCSSCRRCDKHCSCTQAQGYADFRYDMAGKVEPVDPLGQRTNFPYDPAPQADKPIIVTPTE